MLVHEGLCVLVLTVAELKAVKVHGQIFLLSSLQHSSSLMWSPGLIVITIRDYVHRRWRRCALVLLRDPRCKKCTCFQFCVTHTHSMCDLNCLHWTSRNKKTVNCKQDTPKVLVSVLQLHSHTDCELKFGIERGTRTEEVSLYLFLFCISVITMAVMCLYF